MTDTTRHNDQPITQPSEDLYGFDPFAKAIAGGIRKMPAPNGYVLAINGPWGAGKSSVINLVLHHLEDDTASRSIKVLRFTPWWFRGEEALALAFFRELQGVLNPSLRKNAKKLLPKIGARLLRGGGLVGSVIDVTAGGGGAIASNAIAYLEGLIETDDSLEALHDDLRAALARLNRRFLIVIDDIDRLTPDEALLIFKLVKSVGQLPNVLYLLAYDRALAEKIIAERYPSEGPHFLEKIVQAAFEVPEPEANALQMQLRAQIVEVCGISFENASVEFWNLFIDVVIPSIKNPRALVRFSNTITFSWPAVVNEVHQGDFLALEALRIFNPVLYRTILKNKAILCGLAGPHLRPSEDRYAYCDKLLLSGVPETQRDHSRKMLTRMFPPLSSIWGNLQHGMNSYDDWRRKRRACSDVHFDTYFRLALSNNTIQKSELDKLICNAGNREFVLNFLRDSLRSKQTDGDSKVSLLLGELNIYSDEIDTGAIPILLECLLSLADEMNEDGGEFRPIFGRNNRENIELLCDRLTMGRFELDERSNLLRNAFNNAGLSILVHFADKNWSEHHDPKLQEEKLPEERLLLAEDAEAVRIRAVESLRRASKNGELLGNGELQSLLYRWRDLAVENSGEVRAWSSSMLSDDKAVLRFARAMITYGVRYSGDAVPSRSKSVLLTSLDDIIDRDRFRVRCEELADRSELSPDDAGVIAEFLDAWRQTETGRRC